MVGKRRPTLRHSRWTPWLGLSVLSLALAGFGQAPSLGQAPAANAQDSQAGPGSSLPDTPDKYAADRHTITVSFDYDFGKNPSCQEKPSAKMCVKQFVVYDVSKPRIRLFSVPVPAGAKGLVKGIQATSPSLILIAGTHLIAVTAQDGSGEESPILSSRVAVKVTSKTDAATTPAVVPPPPAE